MYEAGDIIVYGGTGVCEVVAICTMDRDGIDPDKKYYQLEPLFQRGTIYIPVDTKVFMRRVITKSEAEQLIQTIPGIEAEAYHSKNAQELAQHYQSALQNYDCSDLLELTMSINSKKEFNEQNNKKLGTVDDKFMKRAQDLLFEELSVALKIEKEDVQEYIDGKVPVSEDKE